MESTNNLHSSPKYFFELLAFLFVWVICALLGSVVLGAFMRVNGWADFASILARLRTDAEAVNQMRYLQIIGHLFHYLIPGLVFMWWWHQRRAWEKLKLNRTPRWKNVLVGVALVFILFPFVSWLYYWNTALLPDDWIGKDKLAMQEAFLRMRNGYELLVNLFLLGVVAALGEELIFRGIIQRIIQEWSSNVHVAAFVTAALFSFIHFQWEGFIARFVLGLLFCYLLVYTQNLWVPIIMHFVFNSVQVVIPYLYPETIDQLGEAKAIPVIAAVGSVVLFSIVFKLFILNSNHNYKIK